jgi:hypothetical protein
MTSVVDECGSGFGGIGYIESRLVFSMIDTVFLQDKAGFFLDYDAIEQHGTAPHASAGGQFTFDETGFDVFGSQFRGADKARWPRTYNNYVVFKM